MAIGARCGSRCASNGALLVVDEVQKVADWSETVKLMWDEDTRRRTHLKVVLLGSAPLLIQKGLTESLAGRFELLRLPHWSFPEMRTAFRWSVDQFIYYGGYPGAALRATRRYSALEVKTARGAIAAPGLSAFAAAWKPVRTVLIGEGGVGVEQFLVMPADRWLER